MREKVSFEEWQEKVDKYFDKKSKEEMRMIIQAFVVMYKKIFKFLEGLKLEEEFMNSFEFGEVMASQVIFELLKDQHNLVYRQDESGM